jgi:hypothetical protein
MTCPVCGDLSDDEIRARLEQAGVRVPGAVTGGTSSAR